jgi:hypothetical protein
MRPGMRPLLRLIGSHRDSASKRAFPATLTLLRISPTPERWTWTVDFAGRRSCRASGGVVQMGVQYPGLDHTSTAPSRLSTAGRRRQPRAENDSKP